MSPMKKKRAKEEMQEDHIVIQLVDCREHSEPLVIYMPFNITTRTKFGLKFPKMLDRMLNRTPGMRFCQIYNRKAMCSNLDYVLMNCSDDGKKGFDKFVYEDFDGEEIDGEDITGDIAEMIEVIFNNGHASARDMMMQYNDSFIDETKWVRIDITE
jgi:hypothetical protein